MPNKLKASFGLTATFVVFAQISHALSLEDTILYVLETNPEITAAEANKQAIEFELDQAESFYYPRFELEAWAGSSLNNGTTLSDITSSDSALSGYSVTGRISQTLWDGGERRAEVARQALRIDAAALRVMERAEVLSLEAIRLYADVLRSQELVRLARENLDYHREVYARLENAHASGVVPIGDLQQAQERVFLAEDTLFEFELGANDIEAFFIEVVGVAPTNLQPMGPYSGARPSSLDQALSVARQKNPTIKFSQADVAAAESLAQVARSSRMPKLNLEADLIHGENLNGFEGRTEDARLGLMLRYEFQGNRKSAREQEQIRRVSEARSNLLRQSRRVEREVRQAWRNLETLQERVAAVSQQARLSRELRATYEEEYQVGVRSLLDILNTQSALFQAEARLVNQRSLQRYIGFKLLATMGVLLPTLKIEPPKDSKVYAQEAKNIPDSEISEVEGRSDARSLTEWRKSLDK
ncbi:TolC family outer membrane protein [Halocynthiibacter sp. C4]|uniref:TolC family outer membrane protein n=1 Tax=Halocynthiibacter sp. C4 TaxID=2992758 RepID=UPI00237C2BE1|nr:TolC family outer membrane protein [Halocynthiibacter sp. C4]MDE0588804.1 TolC family outer membrane protein [Halocynthiibacter sp. C4]